MRTIIRNDYTPQPGDYHERIIIDKTRNKQWLFDCDGVFTDITGSAIEIANEFGDRTGVAISQKFFTDTINNLDSDIDTIVSNLDTEISAREEADATLAGDILAERTARTNADSSLQAAITAEQTTRQNADADLQDQIDGIEDVIPAQASAQNQLADKDFVNSSVATNTANFVGTFNSLAELEAVQNPSNNDYGFVVTTDAQGNTVYNRYKYSADDNEWLFEYALNNSSFTASQWAAINSGITSGDVTKLSELADIQTIGNGLSLTNGELSATSTGPTVVQTTGTSTTDVMSQNATTSMVFADPSNKSKIQIGSNSNASGINGVGVGLQTTATGQYATALGGLAYADAIGAIAVGFNAYSHAAGSVALGANSETATQGEMNIGVSQNPTTFGYNNSNYRLLTGLYDGQSDHDAVTVGQLNTAIAGVGANEISSTDWSALWQ